MELIESNYKDFEDKSYIQDHMFSSPSFYELNKGKADDLFFLLFKDTKYRMALLAGSKNGFLSSPFSSPFGGFSSFKKDVQLPQIERALGLLDSFAQQRQLNGIRFVLPPLFYNESFIAKQINVFYRAGYEIENLDLDFTMDLDSLDNYYENIWNNAKKNLNIGINNDYQFLTKNNAEISIAEVYDIIKENREFKGKPLNMTLNDLEKTSGVIETDFFIVKHNGISIAGAIVYNLSDKIMYIPFWGDRPGNSHLKPINFLSFKIFQHYKALDKRYVHIGISTESSIPNYGLCEFKESIGCTVTPKFSFVKRFQNVV